RAVVNEARARLARQTARQLPLGRTALRSGGVQPAAAADYITIDLNPSGFRASIGYGVSGGQQVGSGIRPGSIGSHAVLWTGSAASAVDLSPSEIVLWEALGVSGGQQVGWGYGPGTGFLAHALLWTGSAGSVVDLNP